MAFNWQTFKTRTLTAAVFVVVMLAGLLINQWTFFILFSVIHLGCWWEYLKLIEKIQRTIFNNYLKLGLIVLGYGLVIWFCGPSFQVNGYRLKENLSLPISIAGFVLLVISVFQRGRINIRSFASALLGLIYISLSIGLMLALFYQPNILLQGTNFVVTYPYFFPALIITSLWVNDTMAYITGSVIGKKQMSKISPKKTWEGTIGGVIFCIVVIFVLTRFVLHYGILSYDLAAIALIVAIAGTFGDLLESKLKRMANVKDSGHIMPGHGGFLDRFDSLLVATPFVWLYVQLFMH
jgi:phosphatidate cytidylyltransferase